MQILGKSHFICTESSNNPPSVLSTQFLHFSAGETGSAYGGGAHGLSDRYVAGFLWLDKLGMAARLGVDVVVRQSLCGGNYGLLGPEMEPLPVSPMRRKTALYTGTEYSKITQFFKTCSNTTVCTTLFGLRITCIFNKQ
jgi:hypothetical protein